MKIVHGSIAFLIVALAACDNANNNASPETSAAKSAAPTKVEPKPSAKPAAQNPPPVDSGASVANVDTSKGEINFAKMPAQSDAQIAAIIVGMDQDEIAQADVAMKNATDDTVKKFAKLMHEDHTAWLKETKDLAAKEKIVPMEGDISKRMTTDSESLVKMISSLSGKDFDTQYVDSQVKGHQTALDLIDQRLLKDVKSEELKKAIETAQKKIQTHLTEAKALQISLTKATPEGAASGKPATSAAPGSAPVPARH